MAQQLRRVLIPPYALMDLYPYENVQWTAQKLVGDLERRAQAANQWLQDNQWDPMVDAVQEGSALERGVYLPDDPTVGHHVQMTIQEVAVHRMWERHRVLFEIHPGLTRHLRSSDSDKFPPLVLKNLTHPNPLVFLAEPVNFRDSADKPCRLVCWYVAGNTRNKQYVDTTDERAESFHLTLVSEVLTDDGTDVADWDYTRITLPVTGEDATVGELVEGVLDRFHWDPLIHNQSENLQRKFMHEMLYVVVPHMLYLASQTLETKPKPVHVPSQPKRNKWDRKVGGGRVDRQLIGFSSGPTLAALERWDGETGEGASRGPQGARKAPRAHVRRAHFHTYRTGAGRTGRVVKWLSPITVNADGDAASTTAVKVR